MTENQDEEEQKGDFSQMIYNSSSLYQEPGHYVRVRVSPCRALEC